VVCVAHSCLATASGIAFVYGDQWTDSHVVTSEVCATERASVEPDRTARMTDESILVARDSRAAVQSSRKRRHALRSADVRVLRLLGLYQGKSNKVKAIPVRVVRC
jgi:hypothetical protein